MPTSELKADLLMASATVVSLDALAAIILCTLTLALCGAVAWLMLAPAKR